MLGYNNLAGLLIALGRFEDAQPLLDRIVEQGPGAGLIYSIALGNRGDLLAAWGRFDDALTHYERGASIARQSDNAGQTMHALTGYARTLLMRAHDGDVRRAAEAESELRDIAEARSVAEGTRRWLTTRAMLLDAQGRAQEAVEVAHQEVTTQDRATGFADIYGTELDARRIYAVCLARAGRTGAATRQHRSCVKTLELLAQRLADFARPAFLQRHPLHAAIVHGALDTKLGSAW